jgi:hypothetical protein
VSSSIFTHRLLVLTPRTDRHQSEYGLHHQSRISHGQGDGEGQVVEPRENDGDLLLPPASFRGPAQSSNSSSSTGATKASSGAAF